MRGRWSGWPRDARVAAVLAGLVLLQTVALAAFGLEAAGSQRAEAERGLRTLSGQVLSGGLEGPAKENTARLEAAILAAAGRGDSRSALGELSAIVPFRVCFALLPDGSVVHSSGVDVVAPPQDLGTPDLGLAERVRALEDLAHAGGDLREIAIQAEAAVAGTADAVAGARGLRLAARCALRAGEDDHALRAAGELLRRWPDLCVPDDYPFGAGAAAVVFSVHRRRLLLGTPGAETPFAEAARRWSRVLLRAPLPPSLRAAEASTLRAEVEAAGEHLDAGVMEQLLADLTSMDRAEQDARLIRSESLRAAMGDARAAADGAVAWVTVPDGEEEFAWALAPGRDGGLLAMGTTVEALRDHLLLPLMVGLDPRAGVAIRLLTPDRRPVDGRGPAPDPEAALASRPILLPTGALLAEATLQDRGLLDLEAARQRNLVLGVVAAAVLAMGLGWLLVTRMVRAEVRLANMKADFVSGVSHELKTPLTSIRMFLETLREGRARTEEERRECLDVLEREAGRLDRLVEGVLEFSRHAAGTARLRLAPEDPARVVAEAEEVFRGLVQGGDTDFRVEVESDLPVLQLDRDAVTQVLLNLLDNAVKYAPGPRTVVLRASREAAGGLRLEVEDDGPGVPPAERTTIFQDFVRGADAGNSGAGGTGLGLALVRRIVAAHGGSVHVEAGATGGARFVVTLLSVSTGGA